MQQKFNSTSWNSQEANDQEIKILRDTYSDILTQRNSMSMQEAIVTNKRYMNSDVIWGRPKGRLYGNLPGAGIEQKANDFPDGAATYNVADITLPPEGSLTLNGQFPHSRYFSITIANQLGGDQYGNGRFLRGNMIMPDPGSSNPFWPSADRNASPRNYTLRILQGNPPKKPSA